MTTTMMGMAARANMSPQAERWVDLLARDVEASQGYVVPADEDMTTCW